MENNELRNLLQQLHDEINGTPTVDEKGSELLRDLDGDIRSLIERSEEHSKQVHPVVIQRLENAIDHFEITHPHLTMLISKIMDSLSSAGI
jgi:hypothetical protein